MARIVCLANSYKRGGRCIAGIDLDTNHWVRPIGDGPEGAVEDERLIERMEPEILDVLDVPIGPVADDLGCQPENRVIQPGRWKKVGRMSIDEIRRFIEVKSRFLLHNQDRKVALSEFSTSIPQSRWKSLQLIQVKDAHFRKNQWDRLECAFRYNGLHYVLKATCPEADRCINKTGNYILTTSLGGPFRRTEQEEFCCWKMIAGVIEL